MTARKRLEKVEADEQWHYDMLSSSLNILRGQQTRTWDSIDGLNQRLTAAAEVRSDIEKMAEKS